MERMSHMDVKFMWGNFNYDFVCSNSIGSSGGILCIWEESDFKKDHVMISDSFVAIYGTWIPNKTKIIMVVIYAPQQPVYRRALWDYISILLRRWTGEAILMGDFNEVRSIEERCGSWFNASNARVFNHSISSSGLIDVKMEGYSFTWSHPSANKMSKLDRFLVSDGIISLFPSITAICLDRHLSDHCPILLCEVKLDFGPIPFRFFHSWFNFDGFDAMVEQTLSCDQAVDLERVVSRDEIRSAVWDYGENKSPVEHFFVNGSFSKGCNSSFIALIPKVINAKFVNDYRPISIIGSVYKVVTKIMANRLAFVIGDIVSDTQSAFVNERQILDGPFILNEVLQWCKRKNKKVIYFTQTMPCL
ncbi:RNA-directed DNA polymerase, eukaryota [Tanacetum coccineum]